MAFGIASWGVATSPDGNLMLPAKSMEGVKSCPPTCFWMGIRTLLSGEAP